MMFAGPQALYQALVIPLPSNHPWGKFSVTPWTSPLSPPPRCHPYTSTLPHGSTLPPEKKERKEKNNSQHDICFIYLTNYLSGNVPPVPLIGSQELDREDGDRERR